MYWNAPFAAAAVRSLPILTSKPRHIQVASTQAFGHSSRRGGEWQQLYQRITCRGLLRAPQSPKPGADRKIIVITCPNR
jgi:hypothetical protein